MKLDSARSRALNSDATTVRIPVIDAFELKAAYGLPHAAGTVAVLRDFRPAEGESLVGRSVTVRTPAGRAYRATVAEVRDHGPTISLFFEGIGRDDIPVGSEVEFDV